MITKDSGDWPGTKAFLQLEIEKRREALCGEGVGIKESDVLRGEIKALRFLITYIEPTGRDVPEPFVAPTGTSY